MFKFPERYLTVRSFVVFVVDVMWRLCLIATTKALIVWYLLEFMKYPWWRQRFKCDENVRIL